MTVSRRTVSSIAIALCATVAACSDSDGVTPPDGTSLVTSDHVSVNPSGYAPLTALIHVETRTATKVSLQMAGRHGASTDVSKDFDDVATTHDVPVLGLYANTANAVELVFRDGAGAEVGRKSYTIQTAALPSDLYPRIDIVTRQDGALVPGMTLVNYFGSKGGSAFPTRPFIFDAFGDIRWALDFSGHPQLSRLFFDDGPDRLQNGNLYFGDGNSGAIYEVDMLGRVVHTWPMPGYDFHHEVREKPNGNFLVTVSKQGLSTVEDFVIEIDRTSGQIVRTWDLRASLEAGRRALTDDARDWIHVNAVAFDANDNTIIISGRTQGVIKLDENNQVVWILGPHRNWGSSGNGTPLAPFLLQPLDHNGQPITDPAVLDGAANHPDFEWNWYQHAPLVMPNGNVMLFDNGGDNRNYTGAGQYSRAVEYEIDAANRTVRQVWAYGKARGADTFSHIVSDVDFHAAENHVIFSPGAVGGGAPYGKAVEVDYATQNVVFEATITAPQPLFGVTFHRTERLSLYP